MEDIEIEPSRLKLFLISLFSFIFFIIFFFIVKDSDSLKDKLVSSLVMICFCSFGIMCFIEFIKKKTQIIIKKEGLLYYGILISWDMINGFSMSSINMIEYIEIDVKEFETIVNQFPLITKIRMSINYYFNRALYIDTLTTDLETKDILDTLNYYKVCFDLKNEN